MIRSPPVIPAVRGEASWLKPLHVDSRAICHENTKWLQNVCDVCRLFLPRRLLPRGAICGSLPELFQPLLDMACALANTLGVAAQGVVHLGQAAAGVGAGAQ